MIILYPGVLGSSIFYWKQYTNKPTCLVPVLFLLLVLLFISQVKNAFISVCTPPTQPYKGKPNLLGKPLRPYTQVCLLPVHNHHLLVLLFLSIQLIRVTLELLPVHLFLTSITICTGITFYCYMNNNVRITMRIYDMRMTHGSYSLQRM